MIKSRIYIDENCSKLELQSLPNYIHTQYNFSFPFLLPISYNTEILFPVYEHLFQHAYINFKL